MELKQRYRGSLLGLAGGRCVGDDLGVPRARLVPSDRRHDRGRALRIEGWAMDRRYVDGTLPGESLIESLGFDAVDQMERYVRWFKTGHLSSAGWCFDIGGTTCSALLRFIKDRNPYAGSTAESSAGNGSIMRLAPVPLFFAGKPAEAIERAAESSRTTHGAAEAVDACRYLAALLVGAVNGASKDELLADHYTPVPGLWQTDPLVPRIDEIASGSFRRRDPPEIRGTGYVVLSLEAALWAFDRSTSFCEGALTAVNLGDDADTTGAVYGQLAGAYYGESGIPGDWRERLAMREQIESFADRICRLAVAAGVAPREDAQGRDTE